MGTHAKNNRRSWADADPGINADGPSAVFLSRIQLLAPRKSGPELPKRGPSTFGDGPGEISPEISPEFRIGKEAVPGYSKES
jgi:hypothetical protein